MTRITNPLGEVTRYEYDGLNRVTATTDAAQANTAFAYDPNGNVLTVTDARTDTTTHIYDEMDRLKREIQNISARTEFTRGS